MNNSKSNASSDDSNTNTQLEAHALHKFRNITVFMYKMKNWMIGWFGVARWVARKQKAVNFRQKNMFYSLLIYELMYEWVGRGVDSRFCNKLAGEFVFIDSKSVTCMRMKWHHSKADSVDPRFYVSPYVCPRISHCQQGLHSHT